MAVKVLAVEKFPLFAEHPIVIPRLQMCNSARSSTSVMIDPDKTRVINAKMHVKAHGTIPAGVLVTVVSFHFYVVTDETRHSVFWCRWALWDSCRTYEDTVDVTDLLKHGGIFGFEAEACRDYPVEVAFEPTVRVTAELTIEYEGAPPEKVRPPPSPWEYVRWAFILSGVAIVGYLAIKGIKVLKEKRPSVAGG